MSDLVKEFLRYRDEDKHECDLLATRTNTLLTSQSFFALAAAALYSGSPTDLGRVQIPLFMIAIVASISAFLGGRAISRGFHVLRGWHEHGEDLIRKSEDTNPNPIENYYLKLRYRPDTKAKFSSIDYFGPGLAYAFGLLWSALSTWIVWQMAGGS